MGTAYPRDYIRNGWFRESLAGYLQQESMFWRRSLWQKVSGLNLDYKYAADFDLWTRFAQHASLYSVAIPLALFRKHPQQKSAVGRDKYKSEVFDRCENLPQPSLIWGSIARKSAFWEHMCRLLIWRRCELVAYSQKEMDWTILKMIRPLARSSFCEALLERQFKILG